MRDPIEYRKARFIMYTVIKAIQYKDVRSLLKMMRIVYEELKNNTPEVITKIIKKTKVIIKGEGNA